MYYLRIPKDRVGVLIGTDGETKERLENNTDTQIDVNKDGKVTIKGEDSLNSFKTRKIVKAIGRGFSPERALKLLRDDYYFELIRLSGTEKDKERIRGRIIGKKGKNRRFIESKLDCEISVFRDTVSIIGPQDRIRACRKAIEMLISGAMHTTVYKFIAKFLRNH